MYVECTRIIKTTRTVAALEGPLIHVILHMLAQLYSDGTHTITVPTCVVLAQFSTVMQQKCFTVVKTFGTLGTICRPLRWPLIAGQFIPLVY